MAFVTARSWPSPSSRRRVPLVTLFSLALRLGDGEAAWRRPVSVALFVLCALGVLFGIYVIIGDHLFTLFSR